MNAVAEQRSENLAIANAWRFERAQIRKALWVGLLTFDDLDMTSPAIVRLPVVELLVLVYRPPGNPGRPRTPRRPAPRAQARVWAERLLWVFEALPYVTFGSLSESRQEELRRLVRAALR